MTEFKAYGKLLITGEYLVLHGARALALPLTKMIQNMQLEPSTGIISWEARDDQNHLWLNVNFDLENLEVTETNDPTKAQKLAEILKFIKLQRPDIFKTGLTLKTTMNFSPAWGFGSSSTLISLLAQWSGLDAYQLQKTFFKGSGYDVACATKNSPIIYELHGDIPKATVVRWDPSFKDHLYFVYLGKKQDSREAMTNFKKKLPTPSNELIEQINTLTENVLKAQDLETFENLIEEHEKLLATVLDIRPVKTTLFPDFPGAIKSLGGWGGDFVMVASRSNPEAYFKSQNCPLIFKWDELN